LRAGCLHLFFSDRADTPHRGAEKTLALPKGVNAIVGFFRPHKGMLRM